MRTAFKVGIILIVCGIIFGVFNYLVFIINGGGSCVESFTLFMKSNVAIRDRFGFPSVYVCLSNPFYISGVSLSLDIVITLIGIGLVYYSFLRRGQNQPPINNVKNQS